jgi:hypothetical protein
MHHTINYSVFFSFISHTMNLETVKKKSMHTKRRTLIGLMFALRLMKVFLCGKEFFLSPKK